LISLPIGILVALILFANNLRDIGLDGGGIRTIATASGENAGHPGLSDVGRCGLRNGSCPLDERAAQRMGAVDMAFSLAIKLTRCQKTEASDDGCTDRPADTLSELF
jgi:hypothetical protein